MTKALTYIEIDAPTFTYSSVLHFEGTNGSTTITDSSGNNVAWVASGNAQISTAQFRYGASSCAFDGAGDYLSFPGSVLAFGTNDYTIDFWVRFNSVAGTQILLDSRVSSGSISPAISYVSPNINHSVGGVVKIQGTTTIAVNVWYHISLSRVGGITRLFLNGAQEGATYTDPNDYTLANQNAASAIGIYPVDHVTGPLNGWIDEFSVVSGAQTFRFAMDSAYLPLTIDAIPSIKEVQIDPAIVGLGTDVGQRATVTVTFKDHKWSIGTDSFNNGTFWGKFRARYGLKLRGRALRLIRGTLGQTLASMETRLFIIESVDGPNASGEFKVVAKDVLKYADDDRAQAPILSNGFLSADITNVATTATLSPAGIGNIEYPAAQFFVAIGGNEVCFVTSRSGDVLTFETSPSGRGMFNTSAVSHTAGDRVQLCLYYNGQDVANIVRDLLVTYSGVPSSYIPLTDWQSETAGNLGVVFTAFLGEAIGVTTLLDEIIEQAALAIWWDDVARLLRLQVLRSVVGSSTFGMDNIIQGSMEINEQPDKRISQVYVYYGKINPLLSQDQIQNFRSTVLTKDGQAEIDYANPAIKKIYSRWIPAGGRTTAQTIGNKQLGRYRDPPRRFNFNLMRYAQDNPLLGGGYALQDWQLQDMFGNSASIPIQIFRLNPGPDIFIIEAEEMLWTPYGGDIDPNTRTIVFDASENNVNLRTRHDQLFPVPVSGKTINAYVNAGIIIGSTSNVVPALDIGSWPAGVTVNLIVNGRIQGRGGAGGAGANVSAGFAGLGSPGIIGGPALYTRRAFNLTSTNGQIWGGGGGGGGGGVNQGQLIAGSGGGGGAGTLGGDGGAAGSNTPPGPGAGVAGAAGTANGGGGGGNAGFPTTGGNGGGPGLSGAAGTNGATTVGGTGGTPGLGIDGVSFVTNVGATGDIRGGTAN